MVNAPPDQNHPAIVRHADLGRHPPRHGADEWAAGTISIERTISLVWAW